MRFVKNLEVNSRPSSEFPLSWWKVRHSDGKYFPIALFGRKLEMNGSISIRIADLRRGDEGATREIWERYIPQMKQLARLRLAGIQDPVSDEEDVALSAFASFFRGISAQRFTQLENRDDIGQVLVALTLRKVVNQRRYAGRQRRGGGRTRQSIDPQGELGHGRGEALELLMSEPSPELAVCLAEEFENLLESLPQAELREIALAKLEGYTDNEIALRRGCARRTVARKLRVIRGIWQAHVSDNDVRQ